MKKLAFIAFFLFLISMVKAQELDFSNAAGIEFGASDLIAKEGAPDNISFHCGVSWAYFFDLKHGIRTGITRYYDTQGADYGIIVPLLFSKRTPSKRDYSNDAETFGGYLFNTFFSGIFPWRAEYTIGPAFGYFKKSSNINEEEYKLSSEFFFAINGGIRVSAQIWRFNLGGKFEVGYVPTKNFYFISSDPQWNGIKTAWMFHGGLFLSYSFDM
jgi:hypothetical protein